MKRVITRAIKENKIGDDVFSYYRLAVKLYVQMYMKRYRKYPMPPFHIRKLENCNKASQLKYAKAFKDVVSFLYSERERANAANQMYRLLEDYYNVIFDYYERFNRRPTMNQISAGMVNVSNFYAFVDREEQTIGSYWMTRKEMESCQKLIQEGGTIFRDELLESYGTLPTPNK